MDMILESQYVSEKQAFIKLLTGARMHEIVYAETFCLIFYKNSEDNGVWKNEKMNLLIDAPFWVGDKNQWEKHMKESDSIIEMDDNMLAYELVNIRYDNLIEVHKIEFLEKYLCISLDNEKMLSIAYDNESDFAWILEAYDDKNLQVKLIIGCDGSEIYAKNIPQMI